VALAVVWVVTPAACSWGGDGATVAGETGESSTSSVVSTTTAVSSAVTTTTEVQITTSTTIPLHEPITMLFTGDLLIRQQLWSRVHRNAEGLGL